jgi:hypothetical protein
MQRAVTHVDRHSRRVKQTPAVRKQASKPAGVDKSSTNQSTKEEKEKKRKKKTPTRVAYQLTDVLMSEANFQNVRYICKILSESRSTKRRSSADTEQLYCRQQSDKTNR